MAKSLKSKGYRTITHVVPTDDDAINAYQVAEEKLGRARVRNQPDAQIAELEQQLADAEQTVRDTALIVKVRALPQHEYAKLKAAHPPQDEDHAEVRTEDKPKAKALWHRRSFEPALVAASVDTVDGEPEDLTVNDAAELRDEWNAEEWAGLVMACYMANEQATPTAGLVFSSARTKP